MESIDKKHLFLMRNLLFLPDCLNQPYQSNLCVGFLTPLNDFCSVRQESLKKNYCCYQY